MKILGKTSKKALVLLLVVAVLLAAKLWDTARNDGEREETDGDIKLHFIYVGQGDSTLIESEYGNILIDAGPASAKKDLARYLGDVVDGIDYMILTHPHEDHIGGAAYVLENFKVENVIMPDAVTGTKVFSNLLDVLEEQGTNVIRAEHGDTYNIGEIRMDILGPTDTDGDDLNNVSIVLKLTYGSTSALFSGDAEAEEEGKILSLYGDRLSAALLKVGHHGSSTSSSERFIEAVMPSIAVISCGVDNKFSHPHKETTLRLESVGAEIFRTDELGNIVFVSDGEEFLRE